MKFPFPALALLLLGIAVLCGTACEDDSYVDDGAHPDLAGPAPDLAAPPVPPDGGAGDLGAEGLPCGVQRLMTSYCTRCHGRPLSGGAPMPLQTYADLSAASPVPGMSYAARSLVRMMDNTAPMPPAPAMRVPASDIANFASWVTAGAPSLPCSSEPARP